MTKTIWVDTTGASTTYVPREKPIQESVAPFSGTISGAAPATTNVGTNTGQRILAADGTWIPQPSFTSGGADQLETLRPSAFSTSYSGNPPTVSNSGYAYDADTNHATTFGQWAASSEARTNNRVDVFTFNTWASKAQTWTSATINVSRSYADLSDGESASTSGSSSKTSSVLYEYSTNNGSSWTTLGTDTQSSIPTAPQTLSASITTSPTMANILVKVTMTRGGGGTIYEDGVSLPGLTGSIDLKLFDVWIDGVYAGGAGNITCNNLTVTGDATFQNKIYDSTASAGTTGQVLKVGSSGKVEWQTDAAGSGSVTSVSVVTANGVSGTVATATTTPAITLTLGAITPSSVASTGAVSGTTGSFTTSVTTPSLTNAGTLALSATGANVITASTNGSERVRIDSSGNVGIGVTPSAWQTSSYKVLQISEGGAAFWGQTDAVDADISTNAYIDSSYQFRYIKAGAATWYRALDGYFYWNTASSGSANGAISFSERMRLTIDGSLGIGTSSPLARLSIYTGSAGTLMTLQGSGTQFGFAQNVVGGANTCEIQTRDTTTLTLATRYLIRGGTDAANHEWYSGARGSESCKMFLEASTGNLGIGVGTASPSAKLTVNSGANRQIYIGQNTSNSNYNAISLNGSLSDTGLMGLAGGGTSDETLYVMSQGNMVFRTVGTNERMRIDSSGNVGIGTSTIVANFGGYKTLELNGTTGGLLSLDSNGTNNLQMYTNGSTVNVVTIGALPLTFGTNSTERMRIDSSGNVGIGTTGNPWGSYDTYGLRAIDIGAYGCISNENSSGGASIMANAYATTTSNFVYKGNYYSTRYLQGDGTHQWFTASSGTAGNAITFSERMRITNAGDVGIGTSSPASKLNVSGGNVTVSAGYGIAWSGDQARIMTPEDNVSGALIRYGSGGICRFLNGSTEHLRVDSSGNLAALGVFKGNSGTKGFGGITTTTSTSTPTGGSSGDHYYIY